MSEYIERGALKAHYSWLPKDATLTPKDFDDIIDAQSAADVEPVVRCGKCKYAEIGSDGFIETCEYWNDEFDTFHLTTMHPNDYCSNGVARSSDA